MKSRPLPIFGALAWLCWVPGLGCGPGGPAPSPPDKSLNTSADAGQANRPLPPPEPFTPAPGPAPGTTPTPTPGTRMPSPVPGSEETLPDPGSDPGMPDTTDPAMPDTTVPKSTTRNTPHLGLEGSWNVTSGNRAGATMTLSYDNRGVCANGDTLEAYTPFTIRWPDGGTQEGGMDVDCGSKRITIYPVGGSLASGQLSGNTSMTWDFAGGLTWTKTD